jgi:hypothetical protein
MTIECAEPADPAGPTADVDGTGRPVDGKRLMQDHGHHRPGDDCAVGPEAVGPGYRVSRVIFCGRIRAT